jgi:hypothetical protein
VYRGNLEQADAAAKLGEALEFYARQLPHIGEALPARWLDIRADIEAQAADKPYIGQQEYFDLYARHLPFDREKALHLSRYFHDLGVFLHFQDDPLLARTVILQNTWATEAVFKMLDDETVKDRLGRFTQEDCRRVWQDSVYADMHPELLALMQNFELCYRLADTQPDTWLVPQLLPLSKPEALSGWERPGDLVLRYRYEFMPKGLLNRLMVRQHRFVFQAELGWANGVLFAQNDTQLLAEIPAKGGEIVLRGRGPEAKALLSVIAADLEALNDSFRGLRDTVGKRVPCVCPACRARSEPEFFEYPRLLQRKRDGKLRVECPASYQDVSVLELLDGVSMDRPPAWANAADEPRADSPARVFISYSKYDSEYKETLLKHLSGLRGQMIAWHDRDMLPGEEWDARIKSELSRADVVVYLVTHHSLATEYIQNVELPFVEERCREGECVLIPVIVDFCPWENSDFAKYNVLPEKGYPVLDSEHWTTENQAWTRVVEGIKKLLTG